MSFSRNRRAWCVALALSTGLLVGCDEKKKETDAEAAEDAGTGPVLGGKLGEAVAAASSANPVASASADPNQPPASGIFMPGEADTRHAKGVAPTVELLGDGAEPRLRLSHRPPRSGEKSRVMVQVRTGAQQGLPPVELGLVTKIGADSKDDKAAGKKGATPAADSEAEPPAFGAATPVVVTVSDATVPGAMAASLPKELLDVIGSLKGSRFRYTLTPTGGVGFEFQLAEKADQGLGVILMACQDTISSMLVALPDKPIGVGGYWMVTDRTSSLGIDVVRYRVFKVASISDGAAELELSVRQYAADDRIDLPLGPQMASASLARYETKGEGQVSFDASRLLPADAKLALGVGAGLLPPGGKNAGAQAQMMVMQIDSVGQLMATAPAGDSDAKSPAPAAPRVPSGAP
jgi:hypothetical protein